MNFENFQLEIPVEADKEGSVEAKAFEVFLRYLFLVTHVKLRIFTLLRYLHNFRISK